jgi:integrase
MQKHLVCSDGSFYIRKDTNSIYVQGTINGKHYKKSIGKKATPLSKKWMNMQDPMQVLLNILNIKDESNNDISLTDFGLRVLRSDSYNRGIQTQKEYERILDRVITPFFEHFKFDDITALDLLEFFNSVAKKYSYDRAKRIKNILCNILETAHDEDLMKKNIVRARVVQKHQFKKTVKTTQAYKVSEVKEMLSKSEGWLKVFLEISIKYGLRTGEAMGLKWDDFDLERGLFQIQRSITKGVITESNEVIHQNKNHLREIYLFPETVDLLRRFKTFRMSKEWLFISKDGRPFKESKTISDYHFKPFLKEINVEYKTLYAMRRTYVSMMRQSDKISLEDIQEVVGHSIGSRITDEHYNLDCLGDKHKQEKAKNKSDVFNALIKIA